MLNRSVHTCLTILGLEGTRQNSSIANRHKSNRAKSNHTSSSKFIRAVKRENNNHYFTVKGTKVPDRNLYIWARIYREKQVNVGYVTFPPYVLLACTYIKEACKGKPGGLRESSLKNSKLYNHRIRKTIQPTHIGKFNLI